MSKTEPSRAGMSVTPSPLREEPSRHDGKHGALVSSLAGMVDRWRRLMSPLIGVLVFAIALWVLRDALKEHDYHAITVALGEAPFMRVVLAFLFTAAGYAVLIGYDLLGFRYIGRALPLRRIALASFVGSAFGNNVGNTLVTGAAVRYWIYTSFGVPAADTARVVLFCSLGFWLGYLLLGAFAFVVEPIGLPAALHWPLATTRPLGIVFGIVLTAYGVLIAGRRPPVKLARWGFPLPSPQLTVGQLAVAILDLLLMATTLWVLLPSSLSLSYMEFLPIFMLAIVAGAASQVPGGLGVFETVVLLLLPSQSAVPHLVAALVAFRAIYYVVPLLVAAVLVALREGRAHAAWLHKASERLGGWAATTVPQVLALAVFLVGTLLLFSGALPAAVGRLVWLSHIVPLPVIEASHFLASLVGMALLLLAHALQRRLDAAYVITLVLLAGGILFSLAKGFDYEEAIVLAAMFGVLVPCRKQFYRRASLFAMPFTWGWIASVTIVVAGSVWLYAFAFKHVEYSNELWWHIALHAEASRALRATVGAIGLGVLFSVARLLAPARSQARVGDLADIERARPIVAQSIWTNANLALRGDKALLFSRSGNAFLMYGRMGRSWVALGDPVGPKEEAVELAWQFSDLCDRHNVWPVFYEVRPENLDLYLDLGLSFTKLGEEARVNLPHFDLTLPAHADLRQARSRLIRFGCHFEIVATAGVPALMPQLTRVSDAWLDKKTTREKGFSNASFDAGYLQQFPVAVVKRGETIIAFANVLLGAQKEELSVDLMRHVGDTPNGTMDYLFVELLLWGKEAGYRWFNIGMAPLSGLRQRAGAPLWHRFGGLIYQYGEHFYNFRGLRGYKEKFGPVWTPRYLASPGGLALPAALVDVAALVAGGFVGILAR